MRFHTRGLSAVPAVVVLLGLFNITGLGIPEPQTSKKILKETETQSYRDALSDAQNAKTDLRISYQTLQGKPSYWWTKTYFLVTEDIIRRAQSGEFKHPEIVLREIVEFHKYYAINRDNWNEGKNAEEHWRLAFEEMDRAFEAHIDQSFTGGAVKAILEGAKAHIRGDLPRAIKKVLEDYPQVDLREVREDYDKMNSTFDRALETIKPELPAFERRKLAIFTTAKNIDVPGAAKAEEELTRLGFDFNLKEDRDVAFSEGTVDILVKNGRATQIRDGAAQPPASQVSSVPSKVPVKPSATFTSQESLTEPQNEEQPRSADTNINIDTLRIPLTLSLQTQPEQNKPAAGTVTRADEAFSISIETVGLNGKIANPSSNRTALDNVTSALANLASAPAKGLSATNDATAEAARVLSEYLNEPVKATAQSVANTLAPLTDVQTALAKSLSRMPPEILKSVGSSESTLAVLKWVAEDVGRETDIAIHIADKLQGGLEGLKGMQDDDPLQVLVGVASIYAPPPLELGMALSEAGLRRSGVSEEDITAIKDLAAKRALETFARSSSLRFAATTDSSHSINFTVREAVNRVTGGSLSVADDTDQFLASGMADRAAQNGSFSISTKLMSNSPIVAGMDTNSAGSFLIRSQLVAKESNNKTQLVAKISNNKTQLSYSKPVKTQKAATAASQPGWTKFWNVVQAVGDVSNAISEGIQVYDQSRAPIRNKQIFTTPSTALIPSSRIKVAESKSNVLPINKANASANTYTVHSDVALKATVPVAADPVPKPIVAPVIPVATNVISGPSNASVLNPARSSTASSAASSSKPTDSPVTSPTKSPTTAALQPKVVNQSPAATPEKAVPVAAGALLKPTESAITNPTIKSPITAALQPKVVNQSPAATPEKAVPVAAGALLKPTESAITNPTIKSPITAALQPKVVNQSPAATPEKAVPVAAGALLKPTESAITNPTIKSPTTAALLPKVVNQSPAATPEKAVPVAAAALPKPPASSVTITTVGVPNSPGSTPKPASQPLTKPSVTPLPVNVNGGGAVGAGLVGVAGLKLNPVEITLPPGSLDLPQPIGKPAATIMSQTGKPGNPTQLIGSAQLVNPDLSANEPPNHPSTTVSIKSSPTDSTIMSQTGKPKNPTQLIGSAQLVNPDLSANEPPNHPSTTVSIKSSPTDSMKQNSNVPNSNSKSDQGDVAKALNMNSQDNADPKGAYSAVNQIPESDSGLFDDFFDYFFDDSFFFEN